MVIQYVVLFQAVAYRLKKRVNEALVENFDLGLHVRQLGVKEDA